AAPLLRELRDRTQETTLLTRPVAGGRVHVAQFESPHHVRMTVELGAFRPWHAGASGKILLAFAEPEFRERAIAQEAEVYDLGEEAIAALKRDLEHARERGYVTSSGERNPDAGAVAAPVFVRGVAIAAVSVCGPRSRFTPAHAERIAPMLLNVTQRLSARLSWAPRTGSVVRVGSADQPCNIQVSRPGTWARRSPRSLPGRSRRGARRAPLAEEPATSRRHLPRRFCRGA